MDYFNALGLTRYVPRASSTDLVLGVSFPLDGAARAFCQAVADSLGLPLVEEGRGLHWGPQGEVTQDPAQCLKSAAAKRQLWQQLYSAYDAQHGF
ncbi:hypothetical protein [Gallaecimonas xiamenensis]|uniref:Uncharacterized protein n=1 Tax=Gallaecimonas xiamenensis 3-C-1 TaxID=745411 RepID=K2K4K3_9GAMM|nr:hypothetical protein [Gallaecimonas xiamenensis]EKE72415.1 hypothetical protein B3C1_11302 [Gallaecimonas xiamenensis 3-C-1]